jgi:diguanylate cyclase (GGDEF)-like protein
MPTTSTSHAWGSSQLVEYLAVLTEELDEAHALRAAVERAMESLDAEVGILLGPGSMRVVVGLPSDDDRLGMVLARIHDGTSSLAIPGFGPCRAATVALDVGADAARLVLIRTRDDDFVPDEMLLLHGMAWVLDLVLRQLRVVATLQERQLLLEQLSAIQRAITRRAPLRTILDTITAGAQKLLGDDAVGLSMFDPDDPQALLLVSSTGLDPELARRMWRMTTHEGGVSAMASLRDELVVIDQYAGSPHARPEYAQAGIRSAMAAPVHEGAQVVGSLVVASFHPDRVYTEGEQEVLKVFAEQVSLAVTDAKMHEAMREAYHDRLTGLASRALFMDQLAHELAIAAYRHSRLAALFVDLDRFKTVNDSLGHAAGDDLLVEVAARLRSCLRPADTAARLGGDEFALVLCDVTVAQAEAVATRILEVLHAPFVLNGHRVFVTASIGIAFNNDFETVGDTLIRNADLAMYQAKKNGTGGYEIYQPAMLALFLRSLDLEAQLHRAVDHGELIVHYQPIVRLADREIVGLEALVRWPHPARGLLLPGEFIPLAEQSGLILAIDRLVLRQACATVSRWNALRAGLPPLAISINLAASHLQQADLPAVVASTLVETGLQPDCLVLEITESLVLADDTATVERLAQLKSLLVRLYIDDFGTGYSSLAYLRRFPVDGIKIDKSFIDEVATNPDAAALVRAIVQIGRTMGLGVVAEGVEFPEQVAELCAAGCPHGQGYYFAAPMDPHELEPLLQLNQTDLPEDARSRRA